MSTNSFFKQVLFVLTIILCASCDKDYNEIGADLINQNGFEYSNYTSNVIAYNEKIGPIASNNLPVNPLGIYDNPAFGTTIANFATQVQLASVRPTIDASLNQYVKSVILNIPYFVDATQTKIDPNGGNTYVLDSIYGEKLAKMKLSVYESGYYMRDLDPDDNFKSSQRFYTNQNSEFDTYRIGNRLNDDTTDPAQKDGFFFDPTQIKITTKNADSTEINTYSAPAMRLKLNTTFFKNKILKAASSKLATNDVFKDYFRGLYFKVEKVDGSNGSLSMLDFSKGTITINYREDKITTINGVPTPTRVDKSILLNLSGNTVSLLEESSPNADYSTAISTASETEGDERLYLKGGQGALTVIKLFNNPGELEALRANNWLINEASLEFHIDASKMQNSFEPQRIYLYDFTNNRIIADYDFTQTSKNGNFVFDGRLVKEKVVNGRGLTYKIRVTNHIRSLLKKGSTSENVQLGVVVTENISNYVSNKLKSQTGTIKEAPQALVMNPLGTVLYGSKSSVAEDKRLKLKIYYTKPN